MNERLDELIDAMLANILIYVGDGGYVEEILHMSGKNYCRVLDGGDELQTVFATRHDIFLPPSGFDLKNYLPPGLTLPADVTHFYSRICYARLWWRRLYTLELPGLAGIETGAPEWRKLEPPNFLLRFCEIEAPDCYYALRTRDNGKNWDIVFATDDQPDLETINEDEALHPSFTSWLERMHVVNGWPPFAHLPEETHDFSCYVYKRMPDNEAEKRFGPLEKLLPPIEPKFYNKLPKLR